MSATTVPAGTRYSGAVQRPALPTLVAVELRKSVDTVVGRWLLVVLAVITLAALVLQAVFIDADQRSFVAFAGSANRTLSLLVPILGVLLVSGEFSQRTLLQTFALVPSRSTVIVAKMAAGVLLGVGAAVVAVLLAAATTAVTAAVDPDTSWEMPLTVLGQLVVVQVVFVLVGAAFGLLFQNTPAAVVAFLLLPFVFTLITALVPGAQTAGGWLDLTTASAPLLGEEAVSAREWARAGTATAVWFGIPCAVGMARLLRREIA